MNTKLADFGKSVFLSAGLLFMLLSLIMALPTVAAEAQPDENVSLSQQPRQSITPEQHEQGLTRLITEIYRTNSYLYGVVVVLVMAIQGAVLGFLMDRLMRRLGIDLGKLKHLE